jgi:hypothetical protein
LQIATHFAKKRPGESPKAQIPVGRADLIKFISMVTWASAFDFGRSVGFCGKLRGGLPLGMKIARYDGIEYKVGGYYETPR